MRWRISCSDSDESRASKYKGIIMTASITMNNQLSLQSSYQACLQKTEVSINPAFLGIEDAQQVDVSSTPDTRHPTFDFLVRYLA